VLVYIASNKWTTFIIRLDRVNRMKKNNKKKQMNTKIYGLPPQNIEAEASLLSAILIDNRILDDVVDVLTPIDFYRSAHQIIFKSMIELVEKKEPIDP
jgi:replicative DNA helicase